LGWVGAIYKGFLFHVTTLTCVSMYNLLSFFLFSFFLIK